MSGKMEQYRELYRELGDVPFPEFAAAFKERYGVDAASSSYYATKTKMGARAAPASPPQEEPQAPQQADAEPPKVKPRPRHQFISMDEVLSLVGVVKLLEKMGRDDAHEFVESIFRNKN